MTNTEPKVYICPETKAECHNLECRTYAGCEEWAKRVLADKPEDLEDYDRAAGMISDAA